MSKDLSFIPIIAKALQSDNPKKALLEAFHEIRQLSNRADHKQMYIQFQKFIDTIYQQTEAKYLEKDFSDLVVKELILELTTDTFEGDSKEKDAAIALINSEEKWQDIYNQITKQLQDQPEPSYTIFIEKDSKRINTITLTESVNIYLMKDIFPGHYTIKLNTGRVLWDSEFSDEDLIWTRAYPDIPLKLAADTDDKEASSKREINLLDNKLVIQVFPGMESGTLKIKL